LYSQKNLNAVCLFLNMGTIDSEVHFPYYRETLQAAPDDNEAFVIKMSLKESV